MTRLILLDRDGVINFDSPDYITDAHEWVDIPGSLDAIAALKRHGYLVAVCTNQAGVGRGLLSEAALARIHDKLSRALAVRGVALDGLRYCPHAPDAGCRCRKPEPGMLLDVLDALAVAPAEAVYVGDNLKDVRAALAAGVRPALVRTGHGAEAEAGARGLGVSWISDDLAEFARGLIGTARC